MKTQNLDAEKDEMRAEYDLTQLQVRKRGPGREGIEVYLEPDVAKVFPNSAAVNEALRFLIRATQNFHKG